MVNDVEGTDSMKTDVLKTNEAGKNNDSIRNKHQNTRSQVRIDRGIGLR